MKIKLTPIGRFTKSIVLKNVRRISDVRNDVVEIKYLLPNGEAAHKCVDLDKYTIVVWGDEE